MLFVSLLLGACSKEEKEELQPVSNSIVTGQCTTTSFTASLSCTFNGVDKLDMALGKHGVLYCVWSEDVEQRFRAWLDGSDNPGCIVSDKGTVSNESMECTLDGLSPDTEYSYCLFLQKRNGTREVGAVSTFRTQPFWPEIKEVALKGIQSFVAFAETGIVINEKDAACCEMGVIISGQSNANINNSIIYRNTATYSDDNFKSRMKDLESDRDYYCRAYVKYPVSSDKYDYVYGPEKTFRTKDFYTVAVDLGLPSGTLWASYNVGADKPDDYGDYFAWGEVEPKTNYTWNNYKWRNNKKYNTDTTSVNVSHLKYIQLEDDAANYNWGGNWRMPSNEDVHELNEYCYSYVDTINGVRGSTFVSEINGNTFFIPYSGVTCEDAVICSGVFWLNFLRDMFFCDGAYAYWMWKAEPEWTSWDDFKSKYSNYCGGMQYGRTIRPVYPQE